MFYFFDYLYYRSCRFYRKHEGEKSGFAVTALFVVAAAQVANLMSIGFLYSIIFQQPIILNKIMTILLCTLLLVLNGIRYNKVHFETLDQRWGNEEVKLKKKRGVIVFLSFAFSIALCFGLAVY